MLISSISVDILEHYIYGNSFNVSHSLNDIFLFYFLSSFAVFDRHFICIEKCIYFRDPKTERTKSQCQENTLRISVFKRSCIITLTQC